MESANFSKLKPASKQSSLAGKGASKKTDTRPEVKLRKAIWKAGLRYRKYDSRLPGKPDLVFSKSNVVIFCDGDFWHGNNWKKRKQKLKNGSNATYWIAKIESNIERDKKINTVLRRKGWSVLRFWESDINHNIDKVLVHIRRVIQEKSYMGERGND